MRKERGDDERIGGERVRESGVCVLEGGLGLA